MSDLRFMWKVQIFEESWNTPSECSAFRKLEGVACGLSLSLEPVPHPLLSSGRVRSKKPADSFS